MPLDIEKGNRIFHKSLTLLENRWGLKINKAILIMETDFHDNLVLHLKNDIPTFQLVLGYMTEQLNELCTVPRGQMLVTCTKCNGTGEIVSAELNRLCCSKCQGGGLMLVIQAMENQNDGD